ncbi:GNAT family N-acetyltransferase [Janibacter sp. YIM B02568]|uniref:GNAT family N-acetyltransferase n=1 Tax=Janibacter endophyticus TaxID=2806261 RepID=UPI00194F4EE3|nr:GNAT family N-acetyltransferase [Janibacter endophyticus]MBM6546690.1 GNAT family N-acetyltransferase [Janibacter endophyticus]
MSYRPFVRSSAEMPTTVAGPGFTLRPPSPDDARALGELVGDPARADSVVRCWVDRWDRDGYGTWVVEGEGGESLGFVGLRPRAHDITVTVRSDPASAQDGRARAALRRAVAHGLEWYPDVPLRMRVPAGDITTHGVSESAGLIPVPAADHEARGTEWRVLQAPRVRVLRALTPAVREQLIDLWVRVNEAGGAVGFGVDATRADVEAELDRRAQALATGALTVVTLVSPSGDLLGVGFLRRASSALLSHVRNVEVVMVEPERRGLSLGRHLMAVIHRTAREEGVEILTLDYRDGLGLGDFYESLGYREVGRHPGLIRVAEGDDRDGVLMMRRID